MALIGRGLSRGHQLLAYTRPCLVSCTRITMATTAKEEQDQFWEKNRKLNRPMSPHLTIYKPQITTMLSITHRATGIALTGVLYAFGLTMSVLPGDFATYLALVQSWSVGPALIGLTKFGIAWPMAFHTLNGVRHLCWDMGYGFELKNLYTTGWFVLGLSLAVGIGIAAV
ncbi:succinate dehydrogenase cytochrome b560 subunit, mitochondrial-like [Apostichopus japonicus]|uniref:succinate dehydrogenase cytochrome b560 subunit, mitochondrial-like n=1 Tax=Stichopus japonicus TaxID=307972 RepID=UPI003AB87873